MCARIARVAANSDEVDPTGIVIREGVVYHNGVPAGTEAISKRSTESSSSEREERIPAEENGHEQILRIPSSLS